MASDESGRVAFREGLFSGPLDRLEAVHLCGSRCDACGETGLGASVSCQNCGSGEVRETALGDGGTLYTYTVVRHRPPGNYHGPAEFVPFGLGLVQVDDVLRVLAPIDLPIEALEIGMPLRFHPYVLRTDEQGREVVAFNYRAVGE